MSSLRWMLLTLSLVVGTGCATVPGGAVTPTGDPWEGFNRKAFSFNEKVDAAVLRPVALG
jgi:phospholipid-binding lipoprotein MlaA